MNKKIIYATIACLAVLPQLLQAQNVGIGTIVPATPFEVSSHGRTATLSYTDSAMGPTFSYANYAAAPTGVRGSIAAQA